MTEFYYLIGSAYEFIIFPSYGEAKEAYNELEKEMPGYYRGPSYGVIGEEYPASPNGR